MRVSLAAPEVIDAGFLTADLVDETGTKTLEVDYSGTYQGQEVWGVFLNLDADMTYNSSLRYNSGTVEAPVSGQVFFKVSGFAHLRFDGSNGDDTVYGTTGSDTIYGGSGNDDLYGNGGADRLFGGEGDDEFEFSGLHSADRAYGGSGKDQFLRVGVNDTIDGGEGIYDEAWLSFRNQSEGVSIVLDDLATQGNVTGVERISLKLTSFNDSLTLSHRFLMSTGWDGPACYDLGKGRDRLTIDFREDSTEALHWYSTGVIQTYFVLPDGSLSAEWHTYSKVTGYERLVIHATGHEDILEGFGNATLWGEGGDDVISGLTYREHDKAVLFGGAGNDTLTLMVVHAGTAGVPDSPGGRAFGGDGDDKLVSGAIGQYRGSADDFLSGGKGNDTMTAGDGTDTLYGGAGADSMSGDGQDDLLNGGWGKDTLFGGDSRDTLMGGDGADLLYGGNSNDSLDGGAGNDTLSGGYNDDTLAGGAGDDTFWFEGVRGTKNDVITDYSDGDLLNFAGGLTAADITVADSGADLLVSWSTGTVLLLGMAGESVTMTFGEALI